MASIKEYNDKLHSLKNTGKMTKTMKMVSASKLRKAQNAQRSGRHYADRLHQMIARLAASVGGTAHPLLEQRRDPQQVLLLVYTSDKGLCGGFNNSVIKMAEEWVRERHTEYDVRLACMARRGYAYFKSRVVVDAYHEGATAHPEFKTAQAIGQQVMASFLSGEYDEVYILYNQFQSALSQKPVLQKLLPVSPEAVIDGEARPYSTDYLFEPDKARLLDELLPRAISFRLYYALLENAAGEHGARMTAMDNASTNAANLVEEYTLLRNRARQAAITTELTEIVSGAEAL